MNKISLILITGFMFGNSALYSQDWNKIFMYESDAEYMMADKQFDKAAENFKKASKLVPDNANFKFKIGYCYLSTDDKKSEAISYLKDAIKSVSIDYKMESLKESNAPIEAYYLLAEAYRINRQFDEAAVTYKKYKEFLKPSNNLIALVDQNIASCTNANDFISDSVNVKVTNLGSLINNDLPNINAVVSGDGKTLAYTNITKLGNDIFISNKVNGVWSAPKKITTQLGNKYLLTNFLSYNGKDLYLSSDDPENCDLYVTTIEKNKWIKPIKFGKPINSKANETHACLTQDGNTIYFTSDKKGGVGGFDIYKSTVNEKGSWGEPVNLGPDINTPFNEATPFLSQDEKYLFFSSEGHNGMGGYDVFYVNLEGSPKVANIGYPVNNSDNNLFYYPENGWNSGFISSYNKKSIGKRDINHLDITRYTNLKGKVLADAGDSGSPFKVTIFDTEKNDTIARLESNDSKSFTYKVNPGSYKVIVTNSKYFPFSDNLSIPVEYTTKDYNFEAKMQPIPVEIPKQVAEVLPKEVKKDIVNIEKPKIITLAENTKAETKTRTEPKTETKTNTEKTTLKPREVTKTEEVKKKITPVIMIENTSTPNNELKISTYAVQLMALKTDVGANYFKDIENIVITITPEGYYRYSVGITESMDKAMATLNKVKELGYNKAFVRIDQQDAVYTIQLMALKKPVDLSTFSNIFGVNEVIGNDGLYRYIVGNFSNPNDAKNSLNTIIESGYKGAFIKKVGVK